MVISELRELEPALILTRTKGSNREFDVDDQKLIALLGAEYRYRFPNHAQMDFGYISPGTLKMKFLKRQQKVSFSPLEPGPTKQRLPDSFILKVLFTWGQGNRANFDAAPIVQCEPGSPEH